MTAAVNGSHIRVGLGDNIRMPNGELAKGSFEQVQWADEARQIFNLPKRPEHRKDEKRCGMILLT